MKRYLYLIIYIAVSLLFDTSEIMASSRAADSVSIWAKQFEGWTEEWFRQYEDSVYSSIYAPVIARKADSSSFGKTTYEYDASGNLSKETDANGKVKEYAYDDYGRLTQATTPELATIYTYKMLIREKQLLRDYFITHGQLPPGNKRFH